MLLFTSGGNQLKTTGGKLEEVKTKMEVPMEVKDLSDDEGDGLNILGEKDVQPVGKYTYHIRQGGCFIKLPESEIYIVLKHVIGTCIL